MVAIVQRFRTLGCGPNDLGSTPSGYPKYNFMKFIYDIRAAYRNDPALRSNYLSVLEIILYQGLYAIFFPPPSSLVMEL